MDDTPQHYQPDQSRQDATGHDQPRPAPTPDEYISIKEALAVFATRGRSVTERTLQRYCEKKKLDGQKQLTAEGEKWFVRRSSVHRCIEELDAFDQLRVSRQVATERDRSAPVAEEPPQRSEHDSVRQPTAPDMSRPVGTAQQGHATGDVSSRHDATGRDLSRDAETAEHEKRATLSEAERQLYERMIEQYLDSIAVLSDDKDALKADKDMLLRQLEVKDRQLEAKDKQIDHFFSSERDTKTLLGSLQSLMNAIWPGRQKELGDRYVPMRDALESGLPDERREEGGEAR